MFALVNHLNDGSLHFNESQLLRKQLKGEEIPFRIQARLLAKKMNGEVMTMLQHGDDDEREEAAKAIAMGLNPFRTSDADVDGHASEAAADPQGGASCFNVDAPCIADLATSLKERALLAQTVFQLDVLKPLVKQGEIGKPCLLGVVEILRRHISTGIGNLEVAPCEFVALLDGLKLVGYVCDATDIDIDVELVATAAACIQNGDGKGYAAGLWVMLDMESQYFREELKDMVATATSNAATVQTITEMATSYENVGKDLADITAEDMQELIANLRFFVAKRDEVRSGTFYNIEKLMHETISQLALYCIVSARAPFGDGRPPLVKQAEAMQIAVEA